MLGDRTEMEVMGIQFDLCTDDESNIHAFNIDLGITAKAQSYAELEKELMTILNSSYAFRTGELYQTKNSNE